MAGRGRARRHGQHQHPYSSFSPGQAVRLGIVAVLISSVIYLFCTDTMISRQGRFTPMTRGGGAGMGDGFNSGADGQGLPYSGEVGYEEDPRQPAFQRYAANGGVNGGATGPMDFVELQCEGGEEPDVDLSYWKDIPSDKSYESPWGESARKAKAAGMPQYVTFEPDHGGFNNIRMAMETVLVFARETGRTLVMPPAQKFYLLNRPAVQFSDMFPIEALDPYMEVICMEDFLKKEGVTGRLGLHPPRDKTSDQILSHVHRAGLSKTELEEYLRSAADLVPHWDHMKQALVFGPSPSEPAVPQDADSQTWLTWFKTDERPWELTYNEEMQKARLIHFRTSPGKEKAEYRLFTHFYTFIGFHDPVAARHHRRLVRDVMHFREGLFCIAATIVGRLRKAGQGTPGRWSGYYGEGGGIGGAVEAVTPEGEGTGAEWRGDAGSGYQSGALRKAGFSTFHIRRGDFQYVKMKPEAPTIVEATSDLVMPGEVLYIATDERDKSFFDPFREDHRLFFLDDFKDVLEGVDPSYYLMIDTIVAAHGRTFIGTWRSTFTGYITRLRGYYRYPTEFSWYFWDESKRGYMPLSLNQDTTPRSPFFMREWPTAWEDIDQGLWDSE